MSDTLRGLLSDPVTYLFIAAAIGLVHLYLKRRIAAGVDHQFAVRLEDHRQSLHLAAEASRYQQEQLLSKRNLYASNAHGAAVEVYRALRLAHGACVNLRGFRQGLTFEEFNATDLKEYMSSHQVPKGQQEEILGRLANDRAGAIRDMRAYIRIMEVQDAERTLGEAQNTVMLNELYFDDAVIETINSFFKVMNEWMAFIQVPAEAHERALVPTTAQMQQALEAVHTVLRERLSGGAA
jgi:hypothetical protein